MKIIAAALARADIIYNRVVNVHVAARGPFVPLMTTLSMVSTLILSVPTLVAIFTSWYKQKWLLGETVVYLLSLIPSKAS